MQNKTPKVTVVMPGYNAEKTLAKTLRDIPKDIVNTIILVDDKSQDGTVKIAKDLGLIVVEHKKNKGYGGNQKTCYQEALKSNPDIIIMLHPDYQYDPKLIKYMVSLINENYLDVVLGSRIRSKREAIAGGMPYYKYISNRLLTMIENTLSGYVLSDWHSGFRAYKREVLENIDFQKNSDDFIFDSQMLFKIIDRKYRIGEIPTPVRYFKDASSINFKRSLRYGFLTLIVALGFFFRRLFNIKNNA